MGPPPGPGGPFGPPPSQKAGPPTGLFIVLGVLVVAAIGLGIFLLTSDDDDDTETDNAGDRQEQEDESDSPTDGGTADPSDTSTTEADDSGDSGSGDIADTTAAWVFANTPESVDAEESSCIADVVIDIVGEDRVSEAGGDLQTLYISTSLDEDSQITAEYPSCLDSQSVDDMAADTNWPW